MRIMRHLFQRFFPQRLGSVVVFYVFFLFFVVGIALHRDYGVSADEAAVRKFGSDAFNYLFGTGTIPTELDWSFFNPAIPMVLHGVERLLGLTDGADIWFVRHLITFGMFFVTVVTFYHTARLRFHDWKLPLLGSVMFMASPRLFAHGFYNPKDIPAMMLFSLSALTLLLFLEKRTMMRFGAHILVTALLISMRVFGLMMPILAMAFLWTCMQPWKISMKWTAVYILTLALALILVWPLLWNHPIQGIINAFLNTASRSGGGFYFGESFSSVGVPWHFLPVWIGITTPVMYSIFFLIGFLTLISRRPSRLGRAETDSPAPGRRDEAGWIRVQLFALLWFSLPVIALTILPIGIFDGWRHMLFLYPAFLLIALEGVVWIGIVTKKNWIAPALIGLQIVSTGTWMLRNHPFEYAYFSIPSQFIDGQFDLDYWGLSYRAGLEWIVKNDARDHINVFTAARVGKTAADTLPIADWSRLYFTTPNKADYILDNFRAHDYQHVFPEDRKAHAVTVDGLEILAVYKGPDTKGIFEPVIW